MDKYNLFVEQKLFEAVIRDLISRSCKIERADYALGYILTEIASEEDVQYFAKIAICEKANT